MKVCCVTYLDQLQMSNLSCISFYGNMAPDATMLISLQESKFVKHATFSYARKHKRN